ncbi:MAG: TerB family tellurite resistance protein [Bacteroidales bacterium]|nr:TerB family tellurite resistance protein [Bacteroidales bacterium]
MNTGELYLKTAFACMACDGEIANEELELVKHFATSSTLFEGLEIEKQLNEYVAEINVQGLSFLAGYINSIVNAQLTEQQELDLAKIAIKMIEADKKIEYSEISFFKRIRSKLRVSDDKLLEIFKDETLFDKFPEVKPEDFLLPDIIVDDDLNWNVTFENIELL